MGIRIHLVGSKNEVYNASGHGYLFHVRIANRTYPGLLPRLTGRQRFCSEMTYLTLAELKIDGARVALCGNGQPLPPGRWVFVEGEKTLASRPHTRHALPTSRWTRMEWSESPRYAGTQQKFRAKNAQLASATHCRRSQLFPFHFQRSYQIL